MSGLSTNSVSNKFIGIPLLFRVEKNAKSLSPFIELGTSLNYYITTSSKLDIGKTSSKQSTRRGYNSLNIFTSISVGTNCQLGSDIQLFSKIYYQRQINSLSKVELAEKLYDYGLVIGVRKLLQTKTESQSN